MGLSLDSIYGFLQNCGNNWYQKADKDEDGYLTKAEFREYMEFNWNGQESLYKDIIDEFWLKFDTNQSADKIKGTDHHNLNVLSGNELDKLIDSLKNWEYGDYSTIIDNKTLKWSPDLKSVTLKPGASTTMFLSSDCANDTYFKAIPPNLATIKGVGTSSQLTVKADDSGAYSVTVNAYTKSGTLIGTKTITVKTISSGNGNNKTEDPVVTGVTKPPMDLSDITELFNGVAINDIAINPTGYAIELCSFTDHDSAKQDSINTLLQQIDALGQAFKSAGYPEEIVKEVVNSLSRYYVAVINSINDYCGHEQGIYRHDTPSFTYTDVNGNIQFTSAEYAYKSYKYQSSADGDNAAKDITKSGSSGISINKSWNDDYTFKFYINTATLIEKFKEFYDNFDVDKFNQENNTEETGEKNKINAYNVTEQFEGKSIRDIVINPTNQAIELCGFTDLVSAKGNAIATLLSKISALGTSFITAGYPEDKVKKVVSALRSYYSAVINKIYNDSAYKDIRTKDTGEFTYINANGEEVTTTATYAYKSYAKEKTANGDDAARDISKSGTSGISVNVSTNDNDTFKFYINTATLINKFQEFFNSII